MKKNQRIPVVYVPKLATGVEGFEHISIGGVPRGRTTLLSGTSGSGKTVFAVEFLWRGITLFNEAAIFVTFEETPKDIVRNVKSMGWDLDKFIKQNKFAFVDASPIPEEKNITGMYDFGALMARMKYAINKTGAKRVVMDSVSALFPQYSDEGIIRRELFKISALLKSLNVTTLLTAERLEEYGPIGRFGVEEFVSDNVMILRNALDEEKRRRTIEILKFRGALHQKGEYPLTITNDGTHILPLSAMELKQPSSSTRISSGNEEIDRMCGGGFFRDSIILLSGATGTGKTLTASTFVNEACAGGEKAILFAMEESREQLTRNALSWGMNFDKWEKKGLLKIICRYPEIAGLEDHLLMIKRDIEGFKPKRIAMDSLSAMERTGTLKSFREFVIGVTAHIKEKEIAGIFTNTTPTLMGGESITDTHISTITDSIILLRYVEIDGGMRRVVTILKMRGSWHEKEIREFLINGEGMHIGKKLANVENILSRPMSRESSVNKERRPEVMANKHR